MYIDTLLSYMILQYYPYSFDLFVYLVLRPILIFVPGKRLRKYGAANKAAFNEMHGEKC